MKYITSKTSKNLIFTCFILLFSFGCKKTNDTGLDILPDSRDGAIVYTSDTVFTISTLQQDSVQTSEQGYHLFGTYKDPNLGKIKATTFVQFGSTKSNIDFGFNDSLKLDSLVLAFKTGNYYGVKGDSVPIIVNRLTQDFDASKIYYGFDELTYDPQNLAVTQTMRLDSASQTVVIKLDSTLGKDILYTDRANLATNSAILSYLKGFRIAAGDPNNNKGVVAEVSAVTSDLQLILYYTRTQADTAFKTYEVFSVSGNRYFNKLEQLETTGTLQEQIKTDPLTAETYGIITAGNVNKMFFRIDNLEMFSGSGISLAELELKMDTTLYTFADYNLPPPSSLLVYEPVSTTDKTEGSKGNVIGVYNSTRKSYVFDISLYLQQLVSNRLENRGLLLVSSARTNSLYRAVFGNSKNLNFKPELKILYTKIN